MRKKYLLINTPQTGVLKGQAGIALKPKAQALDAYGRPIGISSANQGMVGGPIDTTNAATLATQSATTPGNTMSSGASGAASMGVGAGVAMGAGALDTSAQGNIERSYSMDEFGLMDPNQKNIRQASVKSGAAKGLKTGAAIGTALGTIVPGIGNVVGGIAGGLYGATAGAIVGLFKGKKQYKEDQAEYDEERAKYDLQAYNLKSNKIRYDTRQADMAQANALYAKKGVKTTKAPIFKAGGKLEDPDKVNVIPDGKLHKENNNLGNKDKGIPVVEDGVKKYEIEKEELILRKTATSKVEKYVASFGSSQSESTLEELGKYAAGELINNTQDNTKKFV